ncbi:preprotein translocase subunit SecE [Candidatus Woesebacteria bacterium RIFCSPHIGHO2_01_FULL_44_21]|uniref:Protein translocase subunit SecE n=1 Tax=Candidatus Woesebacteria bacterium RIFCSPHIGHO2_01_FULL_44_21 TaxID=1802503 RepID=A0A1F7Z018_9BACT|nr:MAG: preprotein translocase subunit SecE [Candidatus Woesebacteria bacterium RIFCSPHIGHO2_01_FULL_44_21]OGM70375.1 MAG: preprotein translocase subunit SecE [Candidatus Woesebacteria bacterium RIFCSPLOWO2_01_FULL_44_24b]
MQRLTGYFREVRAELLKVIWPKRKEVIKLTGTVVILSVIVSAYLGALDYLFARALELLLVQ